MRGHVYITGDTHGNFDRIAKFCRKMNTNKGDIMIVLGDAGVNYYLDNRDTKLKQSLEDMPITFMLVRGNHEARPGVGWALLDSEPHYINNYVIKGKFMFERAFPSILYMMDGEDYVIGNASVLVIGGAYSVDKDYRLEQYDLGNHNYRWFHNEQLSSQEKTLIMENIRYNHYDYVFTHTCPLEDEPKDTYLPSIDQSKIDKSMEEFLQDVKYTIHFDEWYCGHWHTDRNVGNMHFMFKSIDMLTC